MRKDRLTYFKKQLIEKQRQLVDEVGRTASYGKDAEDDAIKDLGEVEDVRHYAGSVRTSGPSSVTAIVGLSCGDGSAV